MSDLDDEELEATRKLNGVAKENNIEEDYISKQKAKDKIKELKKEYEIALEENSIKAFVLKCKISVLEELLEDK